MKKKYVAPAVEVVFIGNQSIMTASNPSSDSGYHFDGGLGTGGFNKPAEGLSYEIDFGSDEDCGW